MRVDRAYLYNQKAALKAAVVTGKLSSWLVFWLSVNNDFTSVFFNKAIEFLTPRQNLSSIV